MRKPGLQSFSVLLIVTLALVSCSKQNSPSGLQSEQGDHSQTVQDSSSPIAAISPPLPLLPVGEQKSSITQPPDPKEVGTAVARVFDKVVTAQSAVAVGDFNGDGSQDLAVVVKADPKTLPDLNNELANWVLEDPRTVDTGTIRHPQQKPTQAVASDTLLAIIHGIGTEGWRHPDAKQTFLLKNGAGQSMTPQTPEELHKTKDKKQPALRGDAIRQMIGGKTGLIYWTGAKYAWYSPGLQ